LFAARELVPQDRCSEPVAYPNSDRVPCTGLYPNSKSDPDSHSDVPNKNYSQSDSHSDFDTNSNTNANANVYSQPECESETDPNPRVGACGPLKAKPARFCWRALIVY